MVSVNQWSPEIDNISVKSLQACGRGSVLRWKPRATTYQLDMLINSRDALTEAHGKQGLIACGGYSPLQFPTVCSGPVPALGVFP